MEQAIKKAIEGGYYFRPLLGGKGKQSVVGDKIVTDIPEKDGWKSSEYQRLSEVNIHKALLDPLFWKALGKSLGWKGSIISNWPFGQAIFDDSNIHEYYWHLFIIHLAEGKDADSFFNNLIKQ